MKQDFLTSHISCYTSSVITIMHNTVIVAVIANLVLSVTAANMQCERTLSMANLD